MTPPRRFAISDIHGCLKTFKKLLELIDFNKNDALFLLGDYIDRGPDSVGVVHFILQLIKDGFEVVCLMGNHEEMLLQHYSEEYDDESDIENDMKTKNFQKKQKQSSKKSPISNQLWRGWSKKDLDFIASLKRFHISGNFILVHAGLNFDKDDPFLDSASLIWIRYWYNNIKYKWLGDRYIVHGHTPVEKTQIDYMRAEFFTKRYINIDCSCAYNLKNRSFLCAFNLDDYSLTFQPNIEYGNK